MDDDALCARFGEDGRMIVIVHGWDGSGPGHWQHWLADQLRARGASFSFPALPTPAEPDRDAWVASLAGHLADTRDTPVFLVAHSLGCWAVDHLLKARGASGLAGALLVAPPSPFSLFEPIQSFLPPPCDRAAWAPLAARSLVVASDDDEHAGPDEIEEAAAKMGLPVRLLSGAGHVNAASGFGPFPLALDWLGGVGALPG